MNAMAIWHGMKWMWVGGFLDPQCDFDLWPHAWHWTWIFKVKLSNSHISRISGMTWNDKDMSRIRCWTNYATQNFDLNHDITLYFQGQIWKKLYFRNGWIDRYETNKLIWINRMMVILCDKPDFGVSKLIFENIPEDSFKNLLQCMSKLV